MVEAPRKLYVEPTNACNLDCKTCVRHSWDESEGFMERSTFESAVDGLAQTTSGEPGTVAFMGLGEPLLHPRLVDMVRLASGRGLATEITTNALLLDEAKADELVYRVKVLERRGASPEGSVAPAPHAA